jgi:hypothetical protein
MKSILLLIGGFFQGLIVILHIGIFFGIASSGDLSASTKVTFHIFNAAVLTTVVYFAYISLFRRKEMIDTPFGRMTAAFIALFYFQRGLVDVFLRGIDPVVLGLAIIIPLLYIIPILPSKPGIEEQ